jgi:hypothetical protein
VARAAASAGVEARHDCGGEEAALGEEVVFGEDAVRAKGDSGLKKEERDRKRTVKKDEIRFSRDDRTRWSHDWTR